MNKTMKFLLYTTLSLLLSAGIMFAQDDEGGDSNGHEGASTASEHVESISLSGMTIDVHSGSSNPGAHSGMNGNGAQAGSYAGQPAAQQAPSRLEVLQTYLATLAARAAAIKQEQNDLLLQRDDYTAGLAQELDNKIADLQGQLYLIRDEQAKAMSQQRDIIHEQNEAIDAGSKEQERRQQENRRQEQQSSKVEHACAKC
jgi:hypothetical protein